MPNIMTETIDDFSDISVEPLDKAKAIVKVQP